MMQYNFRNIETIINNNHTIQTIYKGTKLVWEAPKSCFSKGFWINLKGFNNNEPWRN